MFNLKPSIFFAIAIAVYFFISPVAGYAAFPINADNTTAVEHHGPYNELVRNAIKKYTTPRPGEKRKPGVSGLGVAALVLGVAGVLLPAAAIAAPPLGFAAGIGFLASVLAIVFGAIGLNGANETMARAGMILGIVTIGIWLLLFLLAMAVLAIIW